MDEWFAVVSDFGYSTYGLFGWTFTAAQQDLSYIPWYFIVAARGSLGEVFMLEKFPSILLKKKVAEAAARG